MNREPYSDETGWGDWFPKDAPRSQQHFFETHYAILLRQEGRDYRARFPDKRRSFHVEGDFVMGMALDNNDLDELDPARTEARFPIEYRNGRRVR